MASGATTADACSASFRGNCGAANIRRTIRTAFDSANPFIDPATVERDSEWIAGVVLDMPVTKTFGMSTTIEFDHTDSTLPNYRQNNLTTMIGPTARF